LAHAASWSFSAVPPSADAPVQRQEVVKEKTEDEKKTEVSVARDRVRELKQRLGI